MCSSAMVNGGEKWVIIILNYIKWATELNIKGYVGMNEERVTLGLIVCNVSREWKFIKLP